MNASAANIACGANFFVPRFSSWLPENRKVTVNSHIVKHLGISNSYGAHRFGLILQKISCGTAEAEQALLFPNATRRLALSSND